MLTKEIEHKVWLIKKSKKLSPILNIDKMISTSDMWIKHFELRLKQYKEEWNIK